MTTSKNRKDRIEKIIAALKSASTGDYSAKLDFASEDDELGLIADAVNRLTQKTGERLLSARENEAALTEDIRRYRLILDNIEESYFEVDLRGNLILFNNRVMQDLGYSPEELQGINFHQFLDKSNAKKVHKAFHQVFLTGLPIKGFDWEILKKNKDKINVESSVALMRDEAGKPVGFWGIVRDVTERKKAEDRQRLSEEKYRNILENMDETYLETDLKGNFIFFNDSLCRLLGYSRAELARMNYRNCIAPETVPAIFQIFNEIYRTDSQKKFVNQELLAKDGSKIIAEISVSLQRNACGEPTGFPGVARDVTQKVEAEQDIQRSERRLRLITDNIRDVIWTMDFDWNYTYLSPSVFDLTGFTLEEIQSMPLKAILPPRVFREMEGRLTEELAREARGDGVVDPNARTFEMQMMHKTGKLIWVEISANFNRDENGRPFEIVGTTRDISGRKRAEEALRESEQRYRMIIENMHEVIWTMNLNLEYTYFSPSCLFLTGHTPEELMKLRVDQVVTPESVALAAKELSKQLEMESNEVLYDPHRVITIEQEVYHKNGGTIVLEVTATFTRDANGKATGLLLAGRDITARKRAEEEKDKLEAQLMQAQKMEIVGRLAGGVAHDFNNMLSVIMGYVDLAKMRLAKQHPVLMDIAEIEKAAIRSRDITAQLLAFSRKQIIEPKIIDLNDLVAHTQKALIRLIGEDIELMVILEKELWSVKFDPSQVEQILINLAVNARDAMPAGGKLTIETANLLLDAGYCENHVGFTPGDYVRLSFSDNGIGMDKETLQYIFEPFFTTKETGKGTGLGLATVYGIVKQNNGFINVYSEPGHGTTFGIYVPRTAGERVVQEESEEEPQIEGRGNILLVEDDAMVLQITKGMLESVGYAVMATSNPLEALSYCHDPAACIDLVISDVVMPGMSGKDLRDRLVEIRPDIKVLFMSGYTADVIAHHGVLEEGVQFLQKPFTIKSLFGKVKEVMAKTP